jgi:branched-chain amino acid transport system substrate-binding protein
MSITKRLGHERTIYLLGLVTLLALTLAFTSPAAAAAKKEKKEILIGTNLPLTGILSMVGIEQRWAYETAVADINKAGGVMVKEYGKKAIPERRQERWSASSR